MANAQIYKQFPSGTIYESGNGFYYYVPNSCSSNPNAVVFYPGAGGMGEDMSTFLNYIQRNNPTEIIMMGSSCGTDAQKTAWMINQIEQNYNVSIRNNTNYYGFSAGANTALANAVTDIQNNPDAAPKTIVLTETAYNGQNLACDNQTIAALKQNGSTIMMFEGSSYSGRADAWNQPNVLTLAKAGVPLVIVENAMWDQEGLDFHRGTYNKAIMDNVIDYVNGDTPYLNDIDNYRFKVYDKSTGQWKYIDKDEMGNYITGGVTNTYIKSDFAELKNIGLFDVDQVMSKYKIDGSLKSDVEYVVEAVNSIRSSIMATDFLSGVQACTYASSTKIPSREPALLNQYYKSAGTLLTYMTQESEAMISIAASINELDQKIGQEASTLNDAINSILTERGVTPDSVNNNVNVAASVGSNNGVGVNMAAAGAGAGVVALDAMASSGEPYLESVAARDGDSLVVTPTSDEEFINFSDLDINPNRDIVDYDDYKAVYHYDSNGNVNGFEYYYNFDSTEEAEENIDYLSEKYRDMEGIDYITTKGKQIKIVFKKDYCKKLKAPSMQTLSVMRGE